MLAFCIPVSFDVLNMLPSIENLGKIVAVKLF